MESQQPMDRLLCGDIGFWKTEVVMRAAFKALGDGKQVALLAPTTVLCFQHFETFKHRFLPFPVRVDMLFFFLMIRRPPRSTLDRSSAASDVYKRQDRLLGGSRAVLLPQIAIRARAPWGL